MATTLKEVIAGLALVACVGGAQATLVLPGSETPLQTVIESLYTAAGTPTSAAPNVNTDQAAADEVWAVEASGTTAATFIIELAGNSASNSFGIYDLVTGNTVSLFSGLADRADRAVLMLSDTGAVDVFFTSRAPDDDAGDVTTTASYAAGYFGGNTFGFYLGTNGGTFYSQSGKNAGGADQMVAFRGDGDLIKLPGAPAGAWGSSSYILAWEDLPYGGSDKDFNDLVVYVESVKPLPEPGTLALLAGGLLLAAGVTRRRTRR